MFNMDRQNTDTPNTSTINSQFKHIMEQISTCTLVTVCSLIISIEKKTVCMIRKYHNHTLQIIPWHHEEEPLNNNSHMTPGRQTKQPVVAANSQGKNDILYLHERVIKG